MLRHLDQHGGGVLVYTRNLVPHLLNLDTEHEFVLMYRNASHLGSYGNGGRVREVALPAPSVVLWDQIVVPHLARREKVDVLFNPKYSIPLAVRCPTVFVCHGLPWYVEPRWSRWTDRLSHRYLIPRYAAKASRIVAVSNTTRDHVIGYLGVEERRVATVYLGIVEAFAERVPPERLNEVRHCYGLPERFFLYCGQIYPPKNFGRLLQAYGRVGPELGISLVVAGEHRLRCEQELALVDTLNLARWVVPVGWVDHGTLPAFYQLAEALLLPSLYEACPSPPLEAMASGCPVVTANRYGTQEIVNGAGLLVDPEDVDSIAAGITQIVNDRELRRKLVAAGRHRARQFTWEACAGRTLGVLEAAAQSSR